MKNATSPTFDGRARNNTMRGLVSVKKLIATGFCVWVFLSIAALYSFHFQGIYLKNEADALVKTGGIILKDSKRIYFSKEHEGHLLMVEDFSTGDLAPDRGEVQSAGTLVSWNDGVEDHVKDTVGTATMGLHQALSVAPPPAPIAHLSNNHLSDAQQWQQQQQPSSLTTLQAYKIPVPYTTPVSHTRPVPRNVNYNQHVDMQQHPEPAASSPSSEASWQSRRRPEGANRHPNLMWQGQKDHNLNTFSPKRTASTSNQLDYKAFVQKLRSSKNHTNHLAYLRSHRKYSGWYHKEIQVAKTWCTNKTCLLSPNTFPNGSSLDKDYYDQIKCFAKAIQLLQKSLSLGNKSKNCTCSLKSVEGGRSDVVGLVSLPGSGNTWIRGLLEQVTGICTGSMWCDANLRATQFCAEGMRGPRILALKNHDAEIRWRGQKLPKNFDSLAKPEFDRVIFIHRNPYEAVVAEHNREIARSIWTDQFNTKNFTTISSNDHILYFGKEYFGNNSEWNETVYRLADSWILMVHHLLLIHADRPVLLVHYEDLKHNLFQEMKRILTFLDIKVPDDVLSERLELNFNIFYRNHTSHFEHFTSEQRKYINYVISKVDPQVARKLPLTSYLRF